MASLDRLTDGELRTELSRLGYPVGPITSTTRKVLLKKLKNLLELTKSDEDGRTRKNLSRFSSGDESEDDAKLETSKRRSMPPPKKTPPVKSTRRRSSGRTSGSSQHENETVTNVSTLSNTSSNGLATSSPEKDKFSPSSFADSYFKSKASTGSLFTSLTGRRSYRSDVRNILNSDDTGSDTDVNEEALNSKLSNFVNQNRSRSDDGPARSLELSSGLSTSYIPADSFKNRFLSTKSTVGEDIGGSVIGNDGFENSYSDASRRFCRTGLQPSFTNRIGDCGATGEDGPKNKRLKRKFMKVVNSSGDDVISKPKVDICLPVQENECLESEETKNLTLSELERLVLLEQLAVVRLQKTELEQNLKKDIKNFQRH